MRRVVVLLLVPFLLGGCRSALETGIREVLVRTLVVGVLTHGTVAIVAHEVEESARKGEEERRSQTRDDADLEKRWRAAKRAYGR